MFYRVEIKDHIRVTPDLFKFPVDLSIIKMIKSKYDGHVSAELGVVVDVSRVTDVKEGVVLPGDGSAFYETQFELLTFRPDVQEIVLGRVKDIADFGAFLTLGPIEGMVHISQSMDDFVSFGKDKVLAGRDTKRTLKVGDLCKARIIATSFKDVANPKLGLTMRQAGLGKLEWINEDVTGTGPRSKKVEPEKKEKKGKKE